jgi:hypothetical protein
MGDSARKGKVATLPAKIRAEVNRRLHDGESARQILPWLNADKDVLRVLDEVWHEQPVTPQNLSEWRQGGYQDWLKQNERVDAIKTLSDYSLKLAQAAGGSMSQGMAAIAGGRILQLLERVADGEVPTVARTGDEDNEQSAELPIEFNLEKLVNAVATIGQVEVAHKKESRQGKALELDVQRFRRQTAEMMRKFYKDEKVREIMERKGGDSEVQVQDLVAVMFGEKPS